jgi:hypothetical protein
MNNERNEARVVPKKRKEKSPIPIKMHYIIGTRNERKTKIFRTKCNENEHFFNG